jgi:hypothetical protein
LGSELDIIREARRRTLNAGTARFAQVRREGGPDGPADAVVEDGHVDFRSMRVWSHRPARGPGDPRAGDVVWEVGRHFWRASADEPYVEVPLMRHDPDSLIWGSPLWALHALCGAVTCELLGSEVVGDVETERYTCKAGVERAMECNSVRLSLPALPADEFHAQAWLEPGGPMRRVSCTWPTRSGRSSWLQTDFGDFGVAVEHLERPV